MNDIQGRIRQALDQMPIVDTHTHLGIRGPWQCRNLADLLGYHWVQVELARAAGHVLHSDPNQEPEAYVQEVLPLLPYVRSTVNQWAMMGVLKGLYGFEDAVLNEANWRAADEAVRAKADDPAWFNHVLRQAGVEKAVVGYPQGKPNEQVDFIPYDAGRHLYAPNSQRALQEIVGEGNPLPTTPDELREAIESQVAYMAREHGVRALHVSLGRTGDDPGWNYRPGTEKQVQAALDALLSGHGPVPCEKDALFAFTAETTSAAVGLQGGLIQMFHGSIARTTEHTNVPPNFSYWDPEFLQSHSYLFAKCPDTTYDLLFSTRLPSHEAVSLVRIYFNVIISGAWWHAFSPRTMEAMYRDRLELLPSNAWCAFFSDAYMVEWVYGKQLVAKHVLAKALADMVSEGYLTESDAISLAAQVLYHTPVAKYVH